MRSRDGVRMKHHVPDIIKKNGFACFTSLNQAERAVVMFGDEAYRESLDLENDDAPCWIRTLERHMDL